MLKKLLAIGCGIFFCLVGYVEALDFNLRDASINDLRDVKADNWSIAGENIIVKGNVYIPYGNILIYADEAIVNFKSKDLEASGNIRVYRTRINTATVTPDELVRLRENSNALIEITGYNVDPLGNQRVAIRVLFRGDALLASHVTGNLSSGYLAFKDVQAGFNNFFFSAKSGERKPGGEIIVRDAEITSCSYALHGDGHYSIKCGEAKIYPHQSDSFGLEGYNPDQGEHSIWAYDCWLKIYNVPVLWLPMFYKPKDESPGLFKVRGGYSSSWGYFMRISKRFDLLDYPHSSVRLYGDYYNLRGFGYGANMGINTEYSKTQLFGYGIYDLRPYENNDVEQRGRLTIPHYRYDFRISNVTHITPRLDFRGHFEVLSDMYMLDDFFRDQYKANPQPVTFGALEYQFDRFSTALYLRARTNTFFSEVERLPEFRVDFQRQELFKNIYYQGETSLANLQMRWRDFDKNPFGVQDPKNYRSFRFDTLHMFYYPFKLDWLNIIPRAGIRLTAYEKSSKTRVSKDDLNQMFLVNRPEGNWGSVTVNYDDKGGSKVRFVGEFGVEANTKIYRSWQNVKNAYWGLDGLRHVVEPYTNYTFIPKPTVDRNEIYYFDDIDRIEAENFVRLGVRHRLQTRRGNFGQEQIYNWFVMENYWDYYFIKQDGFNNIGDFCTKISFNPSDKLSLSTLFSIDLGRNNPHDQQAVRAGRPSGRPGIDLNWLNKWHVTLRYKIIEDLDVHLSYIYQDAYATQSAYSMGSTLTSLESGRFFDNVYTDRSQQIRLGTNFPITPDRSLRGSYNFYYDVEAGFIRSQNLRIYKTLHCWEVAIEAAQTQSRKSNGDRELKHTFMATLYLTGVKTPMEQVQRSAVNRFTGIRQEGI